MISSKKILSHVLSFGLVCTATLSGFASADGVRIGHVAKVGGKVAIMTQNEAVDYCREHGSRLPTAKEVALIYNPQGVSDQAGPDYYGIEYRFWNNKKTGLASYDKETLYYNVRTYDSSARLGKRGDRWLWTSSISTDNRNYGNRVGYLFLINEGVFFHANRDSGHGTVRCVVESDSQDFGMDSEE